MKPIASIYGIFTCRYHKNQPSMWVNIPVPWILRVPKSFIFFIFTFWGLKIWMRKSGDSTSREKMGDQAGLLIASCLERYAYHLCIDMFIYILIYIYVFSLFNRCIAYNHCAGAKIPCLSLFSVQMNMLSVFGDVHDVKSISNYTATLRRKTGFSRNSSLTLTGLDISLGLTCCSSKDVFCNHT